MENKLKRILQNKKAYFNRLMRSFKRNTTSTQQDSSVPQPVAIPKAFSKLDPANMQWASGPQKILPIFQKMLLHIQEPQRRIAVLNNLTILIESQNKPYVDDHKLRLQDQIFRGITGQHFGEPLIGASQSSAVTTIDLQSRDFFRLIGIGIHAYECVSPETREQFNKAVMPNVKRQSIDVPYRLQQYVR